MAVENGIVTTVFVYNIPSSMHWKGLWALFGYHGDVVDAFILSKRCRNGNRFGFVRFNNERNAQRAILRLNDFFLLGKRIGVKMARYNGKRKIWRNDSDQKVQEQSAEIVQKVKSEERLDNNAGGVKKTEKRLIVQGHVEEELLWNLQKCLVCASNSVCDSKSLNDRIANFGLGEIIVRRIQGRHFLVEIPDEELMDLLRQTEWSYLKDFFIKIEPWSEKLKIKERVTWIEVSGVPLHCWNYETFSRVAGLWGKLVSVGENLTKVHNFEKIEILISVTQSNMVDKLVGLEVGDDLFSIRVRERGLAEMKDDYFICKTRWKKNEEDSISETGSVARTRPEIPSEGRESVKYNINECQQMLVLAIEETESEYVPKEMKKGIADEADKGLEKALKDVRDMGLDIVADPLEDPKAGGIDNGSNMEVGCRRAGKSNSVENISPEEGNINSQEMKQLEVTSGSQTWN
ncbi:hypothetical protein Goarm_000494 [Gossypium armourianum]|uniref:RRM domain-containing protein n=1 Tax=Gossypium armourianum TaxID=34283 RepID=A0A7J9K9Z9_9ROSI|nr:hypothetical protein [Gossypium armourianum]